MASAETEMTASSASTATEPTASTAARTKVLNLFIVSYPAFFCLGDPSSVVDSGAGYQSALMRRSVLLATCLPIMNDAVAAGEGALST